jgi:hypothetical protein
MNLFSSRLFHVVGLALSIPLLGMCDYSTTASFTGSPVGYGGSTSGTYTTTATAGTDMFSVSVPYSAGYNSNGTYINFFPTVTSNGTTTAVDDVFVDYTQTFTSSVPSSYFYGTYGETIPYVLSSGVSASGYLSVGGTDLATISFTGPGSYVGTGSQTISSGLTEGSVTEEYQIEFVFQSGDAPGTGGSSPAPEPAQIIPAALTLTGFGLVALRRRKQRP